MEGRRVTNSTVSLRHGREIKTWNTVLMLGIRQNLPCSAQPIPDRCSSKLLLSHLFEGKPACYTRSKTTTSCRCAKTKPDSRLGYQSASTRVLS
ncbi:hypothetical protein E2C01_009186 [Portunus trituberculatus]|uniref:Uncharacterized protein n=1 Tax=Portunus trituberculatus TaxID=210409 RepID=A0A5B7D5Q3_PORTR|nr:hypothetical protein [Portunus trituberculatus]